MKMFQRHTSVVVFFLLLLLVLLTVWQKIDENIFCFANDINECVWKNRQTCRHSFFFFDIYQQVFVFTNGKRNWRKQFWRSSFSTIRTRIEYIIFFLCFTLLSVSFVPLSHQSLWNEKRSFSTIIYRMFLSKNKTTKPVSSTVIWSIASRVCTVGVLTSTIQCRNLDDISVFCM